MGPFPHDAPRATISDDNPMGTNGFEFVEFAHPEPARLHALFTQMGFTAVARHRSARGDGVPAGRRRLPGQRAARQPCAELRRPRTGPARRAWGGGWPMRATPTSAPSPWAPSRRTRRTARSRWTCRRSRASAAVADLFRRTATVRAAASADCATSDWLDAPTRGRRGRALFYIDHLTHNVQRGRMGVWSGFYERLFNFREIRFFNINGEYTGLHSRALTSPDGRIRIPINESADAQQPDRGIPARLPGRGHPAHRLRLPRRLPHGGDAAGRRAAVHAAAARDLFRGGGCPGAGPRRRPGAAAAQRYPDRRRGRGQRRARRPRCCCSCSPPTRSGRSSSSSSSARATRGSARATSARCSSPSSRTSCGAAC